MNEAEVVSRICEHLQNEKWHFWIDDHPIHKELRFQKHCLLIGGSRPDIFGLNDVKQIFAVEVKGLKDYKKAIGQALTYKSGVHLSYIGGINTFLDKISNIALSSGLGLISVDESGSSVEVINPLYNISPIFLDDIKNELTVLQHQKKKNRSFSSFGRTHIINYFAPIFLFQDRESKSRTKKELIIDFEKVDWANKAYSELISGANTIGILDLNEVGYNLSKIGQFCLEHFITIGIDSISKLQEMLNQTQRNKCVYSEFPSLAKFLQLIYFQNSDFKQFISILQSFDKTEVSSKEIIDILIMEYPNLFLNFFVKPTAKDKVVSMFLSGNKQALMDNYKKTISDFGHYNFFFAFKRHLVHLGVLSQENKTFYKKTEELDVENDYWILGKDILI
ncbi:hypothetical protein LCGC14_2275790 [marine sediment metagenome]|uniref:Uncharacterized protein n=1 Tax=marine sediment metagenome TaxID=412755 RepID=A0A0F9CVU2_9ZZZZ